MIYARLSANMVRMAPVHDHEDSSPVVAVGLISSRALLALRRASLTHQPLPESDRSDIRFMKMLLERAAEMLESREGFVGEARRHAVPVGLALSAVAEDVPQEASASMLARIGERTRELHAILEDDWPADTGPLLSVLEALSDAAETATAQIGESLATASG